jgi:hypothetical protein
MAVYLSSGRSAVGSIPAVPAVANSEADGSNLIIRKPKSAIGPLGGVLPWQRHEPIPGHGHRSPHPLTDM